MNYPDHQKLQIDCVTPHVWSFKYNVGIERVDKPIKQKRVWLSQNLHYNQLPWLE